jgi:biopolymer transport protein ExbD
MSWRLRHEGSPQPVANPLSPEQILEGLKDGVFSTTDEVRGPGDQTWQKLEEHPYFAETVDAIRETLEAPPPVDHSDDYIDMNPLIDVCLVLLVFFILATTLQVMEKVLRLPRNNPPSDKPVIMTPEQAKKYTMLTLERKGGTTVFRLDSSYEAPSYDALVRELEDKVRNGKSELILEVMPGVDFKSYTVAIDAATAARITKIMTKATQKQVANTPRPNAAPAKTK